MSLVFSQNSSYKNSVANISFLTSKKTKIDPIFMHNAALLYATKFENFL